MKKNIGATLALYPAPVIVVGMFAPTRNGCSWLKTRAEANAPASHFPAPQIPAR